MNLKNDLKLAFKPKMLSNVFEANVSKGVKLMSTYFGIWLVIHVVLSVINGLVDGSSFFGTFLFSLLTGLAVAVMGVVGLLLLGLFAAWFSRIFKGTGNVQATIGLVSYAVLPVFVINVFRDLILFISTIGGHFLASAFFWINFLLFIIAFVWLAWFITEAVALANIVKKLPAFVCFLLAFIVSGILVWPVRWILVKIVTFIVAGVL